jgi:hypothetical protein
VSKAWPLEMTRARNQTPSRFVLSRKTRCCVQWSQNFCQRACAFKNIVRTATATVQSFLHWQKMFDCWIDNGTMRCKTAGVLPPSAIRGFFEEKN